MVIIQHIKTIWTKESRGAPQASLRNQVPQALKIIGTPQESDQVYIHSVTADEKNKFSLEQQFFIHPGYSDILIMWRGVLKHYDTIMFHEEDDRWKFFFHDHMTCLGGPKRVNQDLFNLNEGQIGRFLVNYRFAGSEDAYGPVSYCQDIYNIVNFNEYNSNIFFEKKPDYYVDRLAKLF